MLLNFVIVWIVVGNFASTSEITHSRNLEFKDGFEKNHLKLNSECENLQESRNNRIDYLKYTSIVFGILESVQNQDVSVTCFKDSQRVIAGVRQRETWAFKGLFKSIIRRKPITKCNTEFQAKGSPLFSKLKHRYVGKTPSKPKTCENFSIQVFVDTNHSTIIQVENYQV
jgi:hypothetical protein